MSTRTHVVLLQHPRERDMPIGTARMAHLGLVNSELHVGLEFDAHAEVLRALSDPEAPAVLLYPGPTATPIEDCDRSGPMTLVIVDGTWAQSRTVVRVNRVLQALPRVALRPSAPSEYRIRPEPRPDYVSTIEALFHALTVLEGDRVDLRALLAPFRAMVEMQLECQRRRPSGAGRHAVWRARQAGKPPRLPAWLTSSEGSLVCAVAEANAWPREQRDAWPDELVHWLVFRMPADGPFEWIVAPRNRLAPGTSRHLRLADEQLLQGRSLPAFLEGWTQWIRPDDVLCTWGGFAGKMLQGAGGTLPPRRLDARKVVGDWLAAHPPAMPAFLQSRGLSAAAVGRGRGGERLGQLIEVIRFLRARADEASRRAASAKRLAGLTDAEADAT